MTSKELARILGVSPAAVSIALNGRSGISDEKRKMILEAADRYGIQRSTQKASVSSVINLVIYKRHGLIIQDNPFFTSVIEGISAQAATMGYHLQVSYFYRSQDRREQLRSIVSSGCAGIILFATEMLDDDLAIFSSLKIPIVVLDACFNDNPYDSIVINNVQGSYLATKYLIECGHERILHIHTKVFITNFRERAQGFDRAIAESGGKCLGVHIPFDNDIDAAYLQMKEYLRTTPQIPTAVFSDCDVFGAACMRAILDSGYSIPEDISIIGFDDIPNAYGMTPKLTTIHVPKEFFGSLAVRTLHDRIRNGASTPTIQIALNTTLIKRNTVKDITRL